MTGVRIRTQLLSAGLASAALLAGCSAPHATHTAAGEPKPHGVHRVMEDMNRNLMEIAGKISKEEWDEIARLAPRMTEHVEPPAEQKQAMMKVLGPDGAKGFKQRDQAYHASIDALEKAAKTRNGEAVIAAFGNMQRTCLACHADYRKPLAEHFYGRH